MEGRLREVLEGLLERGVRGAALLRPDGLLLEAVGEASGAARHYSRVNHCTSTRRFSSLSPPAGSSQPRPTTSTREVSSSRLRSFSAAETDSAR